MMPAHRWDRGRSVRGLTTALVNGWKIADEHNTDLRVEF